MSLSPHVLEQGYNHDSLLEKEFDYTKDEKLLIDRDKATWCENIDELNDLWRKRVKNDALSLKLNGKDWDAIKSNLKRRYENYSRILGQYQYLPSHLESAGSEWSVRRKSYPG